MCLSYLMNTEIGKKGKKTEEGEIAIQIGPFSL